MMNSVVYNGKLISRLLDREKELPINTLDDILNYPEYQLAVQDGSSKVNYFSQATTEPQRTLWTRRMEGKEEAFVESAKLDETLMKDEKRIVFISSYYAEMYLQNYPCNIIKLKGAYLKGSTNALGFRPNSPYFKVFSHILVKIKNFGQWDLITTRKDENRITVSCLADQKDEITVGYQNIFSMFVLLGIGVIIAAAFSIVEWAHKSATQRNLHGKQGRLANLNRLFWGRMNAIYECLP